MFFSGRNPHFNIFSHQYLSTKYHNKWLVENVKSLSGYTLDYGCGSKPYKFLLQNSNYIGVDVEDSDADLYVKDGFKVELPDNYFDSLMSTQVLEHVTDLEAVIHEWKRLLKDNSIGVISVPFMYGVHGLPYDFRRFTKQGLVKTLSDAGFEVIKVNSFGGIGALIIVNFFNWFETQPGRFFLIVKVLISPFYPLYSFMGNILGFILDSVDKSECFYTSLGIVIKKKKL